MNNSVVLVSGAAAVLRFFCLRGCQHQLRVIRKASSIGALVALSLTTSAQLAQ
jgi:hypothetical protein